jgi:trans-2,3-dihydro-3-hydroxyanthranilate isomerase
VTLGKPHLFGLMTRLEFSHVDVFTDMPFAGNGLIVVFANGTSVSTDALRRVTAEMRQIELILLAVAPDTTSVSARIFTAEEELPFAGHPVLGAAAVLHDRHAANQPSKDWVFVIAGRDIPVRSHRTTGYYRAEMNQGQATLGPPIERRQATLIAEALGLDGDDLHELPMQVASTGLPYLIVPVKQGLSRARITSPNFAAQLADVGASFVYVFDPTRREGRSWDNAGRLEDIATGSAAGPAAAYLAAHGVVRSREQVTINQGQYVGRPSTIAVIPDARGDLWVGGPVAPVARGVVNVPA